MLEGAGSFLSLNLPPVDPQRRCAWAEGSPELRAYHDHEWGRPVTDDAPIFEKLCLEGFQAGLSWQIVLRKRASIRTAFAGFDLPAVAAFGGADITRLLEDPGIIRNRAKIEAAIANAQATLAIQEAGDSLAALVWRYEPPPRPEGAAGIADLPATTTESEALSKELRRRRFRFVGPTTVYAAMQALGVVNDHLAGCDWRTICEAERAATARPR